MAATVQEKKQFIQKGMGMVEEGLPGWFGTFADMMTLLFAFFVLLAAISTIDPVKLQNMADGMGKSVSVASILYKKTVAKLDFEIDYVGFEIPPEFVVGYGLDYNEKYRNLKDVMVMELECL